MQKFLLFWVCFFSFIVFGKTQNIPLDQLTNRKTVSEADAKLRPALIELEAEYLTALRQGKTRSQFTSRQSIMMLDGGKVRIQATATSDANILIADLVKLGATEVDKFGRIVNAWLPIENVSRLAALKSLKFVKPVYYVSGEIGSANSQGDSALLAIRARRDFCVDGTGVRVGVISDSYTTAFPTGAANGVASGDLPGVGNPNGFTTPVTVVADGMATDIDEGRAMCEIVHDLAPGAELFFNTSNGGEATFANAIINLDNVSNCDIIVDDIRYFEEPFYMDGPIALACNTVFNNGVPYFASAGNYGRLSYESVYRGSGGLLNAHDFDPGTGIDTLQSITVNAGSTINFTLQWDDPWGSLTPNGAATNLDVFLLNAGGTIVASSTDNNIGNDPTEFFSYVDPNAVGTATYRILITRAGGAATSLLKWVIRNSNGLVINEYPPVTVNEMSTGYGHSNAVGANAVAAAFWQNTPAYGVNPPLPENFTSNGGVQIRYDGNGVAITPETRNKPNFCAVDGTSNTFFGNGNNFFGTSAAAPHAAAIAALMLHANPSLTPTEVRDALVASSIDMLTPGFDFTTGSGLIQANLALQNVASPCTVAINDPCSCLNNATTLLDGQFSDSVVVTGPTGQMWEVSAISGLFDITSPAPPMAPTPIAIGTSLIESPAGSGTYVLAGIHVDSIGYSITVTNGTTFLSISNFCVYPTPSILLDATIICENADPIPLVGEPGDDNIVAESFTINGNMATVIDPAVLGPGIHTIVYTVDGGIPRDVDDEDPGCIQSVSLDFEIIELVSMPCFEELNYSLDSNCEAINLAEVLFGDVFVPELHTFQITTESGEEVDVANIREYIGQRLIYKVISLCNDNSCWGYLNIEDKFGPTITGVPDTCIYCIEGILPSRTGQATATDCNGVEEIWYLDFTQAYECNENSDTASVITRVWFARDAMNNIAIDTQVITLKNLPDSLLRQPDVLVELACGQSTSPEAIAALKGVPAAYAHYINPVTGIASPILEGGVCNFVAGYADSKILDACGPDCASSYKFVRTWTVLNWCTRTTRKFSQLIKVTDSIAPNITIAPPAKEYSVTAWEWAVTIDMPVAKVTDNCDDHAALVAIDGPIGSTVRKINGIWRAYDVPKGVHEFIYTATDCCGNLGTASITITVVDKIAPVASAKEYITVSLTRSGVDGEDGIAKVTPAMINNGSYDNCTDVYMEVRRDDASPVCLNEGDLWNHDNNASTPMVRWNNNTTYNGTINGRDEINPIHEHDRIYDTDQGQYVKVCCEDIGQEVKVWLRVWDDADMDGIFGSAGDNYNETWAIVKVEDKIVPTLVCEKDITTYCDRADVKLSLGKWTDAAGNVPASYLPWIDGVCKDYALEYKDEGFITTCNTTLREQPIIRTYRIKGTNVTCTVNVYILDVETEPKLDWPINLHTWTKCTLTEEDVLNNTIKAVGLRSVMVAGIEGTSQIVLEDYYTYVPYYWREWLGTDFNTPNLGLYCFDSGTTEIADPKNGTNGLTPIGGGLTSDLENKTRFNPNWRDIGCKVFGRKIIIDEYNVGEGCKKWIVRFEYIDWCNPEWAACVSTIYKYEDETPPTIEVSMSDTIAIDANCVTGWMTSPKGLDDGGCEAGYRWVVTIQTGGAGLVQTGTGSNPKLTFNNVPVGKWTVHYKLIDGCGNVTEKEAMLLVLGKAPTPYCISLSSAVMKNGTVELWARDFDKNSFDNCIDGPLYFTFDNQHPVLSKLAQVHYFKGAGLDAKESEYLSGDAQKWIPDTKETVWPNGDIKIEVTGGTSGRLFGCNVGDGSTFPVANVKMTVWDRDLLSDFCEVTLTLIDNQGACGPTSQVVISGNVTIESGAGLANAEMILESALPEYPKKTRTNESGAYTFGGVPVGVDYAVKANLDENYKNGVNTLDLVHIQRHIL
ncbi:MAG TPA: S8 family serine peptidase, partial [Saprospiraceae bacterium]|nr:S8 family serine peptidase [Saprospiraceae bacterium]